MCKSPTSSLLRPQDHHMNIRGFSVYEEEVPVPTTPTRHRRNQDKTYEVTTTTESFHRTQIPGGARQNDSAYAGY